MNGRWAQRTFIQSHREIYKVANEKLLKTMLLTVKKSRTDSTMTTAMHTKCFNRNFPRKPGLVGCLLHFPSSSVSNPPSTLLLIIKLPTNFRHKLRRAGKLQNYCRRQVHARSLASRKRDSDTWWVFAVAAQGLNPRSLGPSEAEFLLAVDLIYRGANVAY